MRIGRIGTIGYNPYIQNAKQTAPAQESEAAGKPAMKGWQGQDSYTPSGKAFQSEDGSVTPTGTYDYLANFAANAARFDNFDL